MYRRSFLLAVTALPAIAALVAACGDPTIQSGDTDQSGDTGVTTSAPRGGSVPDTIGFPTGADDVVVGVARVGGFVPAGVAFTEVPDLLITGDGKLFRPGV